LFVLNDQGPFPVSNSIFAVLRMFRTFVCLLLIAGPAWADDPVPIPAKAVLIVSKGISGDGTQKSPFVFRQGVKGRIELKTAAVKVAWNLDDCPAGDDPTEINSGEKGILFATLEPGTYHAIAACQDGESLTVVHAWFAIQGAGPPPPPEADLSRRLRAALVGADAKTDALKLSKACAGVADAFEATPPVTQGELVAAWKAAITAVQWPPGKYPDMPDVIRLAMPPAEDKSPVTTEQRTAVVNNLRTLAATATLIAGGK